YAYRATLVPGRSLREIASLLTARCGRRIDLGGDGKRIRAEAPPVRTVARSLALSRRSPGSASGRVLGPCFKCRFDIAVDACQVRVIIYGRTRLLQVR